MVAQSRCRIVVAVKFARISARLALGGDKRVRGQFLAALARDQHLAFRNLDTDWQIWVEVGDKPVPRKYVITSKAVGAAPQYTLRLRDWKTGVSPAPDAFAFKPPDGSSGVTIAVLKDIDEIPEGIVPGGTK